MPRLLSLLFVAALVSLSLGGCNGDGSTQVSWCFGLASCNSGGGGTSSPTITGGASDASFNDQTIDVASGSGGSVVWNCGAAPTNTAFGTFYYTYSNGTSDSGGHSAHWPNNGSYYLYAGAWTQNTPFNLTSTQSNVLGEALTAWTNGLNNEDNTLSGGGLNLHLVREDNNNNAQIQVFAPNDNNGYPGDTSIYLNSNGTNINSARINIHQGYLSLYGVGSDGRFLYGLFAHELGHALGLKHNPDSGSMMFPNIDLGSSPQDGCYPENAPLIAQDLYNLVHTYDPQIRSAQTANLSGGGSDCKTRCMLSNNRNSFYNQAFSAYKNNALIKRDRSAAWQRALQSGFWLHADDPMGANQLSVESLALASTLVIQGAVGRTRGYVDLGGEAYIIREVKINTIFRHLLGPDKDRRVGDTILYADAVMPNGQFYMDDKPVSTGTHPLLFLKRATAPSPFSRFGLTYVTTAPMVSKWMVDQSLRLHPMGSVKSEAATELSGQTLGTLLRQTQSRYGFIPLKEESMLRAMLANRGVRSESSIAQYEKNMSTNSTAVTHWVVRHDLARVVR